MDIILGSDWGGGGGKLRAWGLGTHLFFFLKETYIVVPSRCQNKTTLLCPAIDAISIHAFSGVILR